MTETDGNASRNEKDWKLPSVVSHSVALLVTCVLVYAIVFEAANIAFIGLSLVIPILTVILNASTQSDPFDLLAIAQLFILFGGLAVLFGVAAKGDAMPEKISTALSYLGTALTGVGLGGLPRFANVRK